MCRIFYERPPAARRMQIKHPAGVAPQLRSFADDAHFPAPFLLTLTEIQQRGVLLPAIHVMPCPD